MIENILFLTAFFLLVAVYTLAYRAFFRKLRENVLYAYALVFIQVLHGIVQYNLGDVFPESVADAKLLVFLGALFLSSGILLAVFNTNNFGFILDSPRTIGGISAGIGFPVLGIFVVLFWLMISARRPYLVGDMRNRHE
jgi:hypothetical protein